MAAITRSENDFGQKKMNMAAITRSSAKALPEKVRGGLPLSYQASINPPDQAEEFGTQKRGTINRSGAFDTSSSSDTLIVEDKNARMSPPPIWNFLCVREIENAKRERVERMGVFPALMADMTALGATYGKMAAEGEAYLATLSDDASDDERSREISARHAKLGIGNCLA
jgi:hypothetical protein